MLTPPPPQPTPWVPSRHITGVEWTRHVGGKLYAPYSPLPTTRN